MRASVDFDDQALLTASKINEEVVNRKLAHEFESTEATIAQALPELVFSRSGLRSQDAGSVGFPGRRFAHVAVRSRTLVPQPLTLALSP